MGRKERRELERKVKHLQKTKPWELQAMIINSYGKDLVENRMNKDILAPGDKVMIDLEKLSHDPQWNEFKPEYKEFVKANANKVFTLRENAIPDGPFGLVSFVEDENKWQFYTGHLKKVKQ
jgi:hypothetical protein